MQGEIQKNCTTELVASSYASQHNYVQRVQSAQRRRCQKRVGFAFIAWPPRRNQRPSQRRQKLAETRKQASKECSTISEPAYAGSLAKMCSITIPTTPTPRRPEPALSPCLASNPGPDCSGPRGQPAQSPPSHASQPWECNPNLREAPSLTACPATGSRT